MPTIYDSVERSELAALREDKARLDWLESNSADLYEINGKWYVYDDSGHASPGVREAIDVASKRVFGAKPQGNLPRLGPTSPVEHRD